MSSPPWCDMLESKRNPISTVEASSLIQATISQVWARVLQAHLGANDPNLNPMVLQGHEGDINTLAFSPNGHYLASGSLDNTARIWDLEVEDPDAHSLVLRGHENWIIILAFSPDGRYLATGSWDKSARIWDLESRNPNEQPLVLRGHEGEIITLIGANGAGKTTTLMSVCGVVPPRSGEIFFWANRFMTCSQTK